MGIAGQVTDGQRGLSENVRASDSCPVRRQSALKVGGETTAGAANRSRSPASSRAES